MAEREQVYAVITGDIIKTTSLKSSELDDVRSAVQECVDTAKTWKRGIIKGKVEFFRGDAWQLLVSDPSIALRVGTLIRARLISMGADTRFSIGIGEVDSISKQRVSLSRGEAFVLSGHGLDEMNLYSKITIALPRSASFLSDWMPVGGQRYDSLVLGWTARQAEMTVFAVNPSDLTHEAIVEKIGVTKQAVSKALDSANWNSLRNCIRTFEKTDWIAAIRGGKGALR